MFLGWKISILGREKEAHVAGGDCMRRPVLQDVRLERGSGQISEGHCKKLGC